MPWYCTTNAGSPLDHIHCAFDWPRITHGLRVAYALAPPPGMRTYQWRKRLVTTPHEYAPYLALFAQPTASIIPKNYPDWTGPPLHAPKPWELATATLPHCEDACRSSLAALWLWGIPIETLSDLTAWTRIRTEQTIRWGLRAMVRTYRAKFPTRSRLFPAYKADEPPFACFQPTVKKRLLALAHSPASKSFLDICDVAIANDPQRRTYLPLIPGFLRTRNYTGRHGRRGKPRDYSPTHTRRAPLIAATAAEQTRLAEARALSHATVRRAHTPGLRTSTKSKQP
jgi:hypothetical protein